MAVGRRATDTLAPIHARHMAEVLASDEEFASEATAEEAETTAPAVSEEDAASGGSADEEKQ